MKNKVLLFVFLFLYTFANYTLMVSYHNIDLAVNIMNLRSDYKFLLDYSPFGIVRTVEELYLTGLSGLIISMFIYNMSLIILLVLK